MENARLRNSLSKIKPIMDRKEWKLFEEMNSILKSNVSKFNDKG
jgi:hypothetical protein